MATVKYFKKFSPDNAVILGNNTPVKFGTADGVIGYFRTDNEYLISEFERFMREGRYGLSEVPKSEYDEYAQKKTESPALPRVSREEIGSGGRQTGRELIEVLGPKHVEAAVAVKTVEQPKPQVASITVPPPTEPAPVFTPTTGKRNVRRSSLQK